MVEYGVTVLSDYGQKHQQCWSGYQNNPYQTQQWSIFSKPETMNNDREYIRILCKKGFTIWSAFMGGKHRLYLELLSVVCGESHIGRKQLRNYIGW